MNTNKKTASFFQPKSINNTYKRSIKFRKILKKTIPFIVGVFFIIIFFWESIFIQNKIEKINKNPFQSNQLNNEENFTFQGIDELEQPFYLHAKKYQIIENNKKKLLFQKPQAELHLKKGTWVTLVADKGMFDINNKTLELFDNVLVMHSNGEQIDTDRAVLDLKKGKFYGNSKLFGRSDQITFNSEGFEIEKKGNIFLLFGKSKIKIKKK